MRTARAIERRGSSVTFGKKMNPEIGAALVKLSATLRDVGEGATAGEIDAYLAAPQNGLEAFLRSNELWGGSGSIADQAGVGFREKRRKVEAALIALGDTQTRAGITNARTSRWTEVFKQWRADGV